MSREAPIINTGQAKFSKWTTRDQKRFKRAMRRVKKLRNENRGKVK